MAIARRASSFEERLRRAVSVRRLRAHLEKFSTLHREAGSPDERAAVDYIAETLRADGVEVTIHEFRGFVSLPRDASLDVLTPDPMSIPCRPRSFGANTPPGGLEGELVFAGSLEEDRSTMIFARTGDDRDYDGIDARGKIVLGTAGGPDGVKRASDHGAIAYIHMWPSGEDAIHEMIVTSIWGTPTPESIGRLPRIPALSIKKADGQRLRTMMARGPVRVRIHARAETGWRTLPLAVADIRGAEPEFLLVGAHIDSWYEGVTDNATGDACLLEMARVLHTQRGRLRRGVRFAWWPGHSHGRYAGSTWYADHAFDDLRRYALGYLNIDSPGVRETAIFDCRYNMGEVEDLMKRTVPEVTGQSPNIRRPFKAGDQSFWGIGLPSLGAFRMLPLDHPERATVGGSGAGWWWHTPADTLERADPAILASDTQLYLTIAARVVMPPVLPFNFVPTARDFSTLLVELREAAGGGGVSLDDLVGRAQRFEELAERLERARAALADAAGERKPGRRASQQIARLNRGLMALSRMLNPVLYTVEGPYDHDPALQVPMLPGLQGVRRLAALDPDSDEYGFLRTRLVRERNRVADALASAADHVGWLLAQSGVPA
ncbi:MAG: M28 family peptidase [Armatimonadota bacterium]|nr:M28 family peptidase [Armatimonadota bacterium]